MFTKILVALDGSDHAHKALEMATKLATRCGAELVLVHALQIRSLRTDYEAVVSDTVRDAYLKIGKQQGDAHFSHAAKEAKELGVTKIKPVMKGGEPVKVALKVAKKQKAELVVVGTRGLTGLRELAPGSVAHKLTSMADCPVMEVR